MKKLCRALWRDWSSAEVEAVDSKSLSFSASGSSIVGLEFVVGLKYGLKYVE
jgi:hypothetical protein